MYIITPNIVRMDGVNTPLNVPNLFDETNLNEINFQLKYIKK